MLSVTIFPDTYIPEDYTTAKTKKMPTLQVRTLHEHYFKPQLSFGGCLIGVCTYPGCPIIQNAEEIERRMNSPE